jgi:chromosome segregation ATPase
VVVGKLGLCRTAEAYSIIEHELPWLLSQLTAALTAALARAEAEREKWQEREAVYKSQIEAGAKRIEAAEKALDAVKAELAWMGDRAEWFAHNVAITDGVSISTELERWQRRIRSAAGGQ